MSFNLQHLVCELEEKEIMTVKQVAEYLQMDEHTIYKLARTGLIPALKTLGSYQF